MDKETAFLQGVYKRPGNTFHNKEHVECGSLNGNLLEGRWPGPDGAPVAVQYLIVGDEKNSSVVACRCNEQESLIKLGRECLLTVKWDEEYFKQIPKGGRNVRPIPVPGSRGPAPTARPDRPRHHPDRSPRPIPARRRPISSLLARPNPARPPCLARDAPAPGHCGEQSKTNRDANSEHGWNGKTRKSCGCRGKSGL